jgi:hypothetical protein
LKLRVKKVSFLKTLHFKNLSDDGQWRTRYSLESYACNAREIWPFPYREFLGPPLL